MKKLTFLFALTIVVFNSSGNIQETRASQRISAGDITALNARGFDFLGLHDPVCSPRMLDSTNLPETVQIKMSLDIRKAKNLQITWLGASATQKIATDQNDVILSEGFEGDFPGANWQISGDPTWGKSNYTKRSGQNSVFCAKDSTAGVTPPANYPNNMNAMMVFGPFDLSDASLAFVRFGFWLETEKDKDWLWYMASNDGINFSGFGLSGSTGTSSPAWEQTSLNLAEMPDLGSLIGQSSVWIAFGFTSDSTGAKRGAFVDDVEVQKAAIGTGISGYLKGSLSPAGNPYIAFDNVGIAENDSLQIEPGVDIRFDNPCKFIIAGKLTAEGTEVDSIIFVSTNNERWGGINFINTKQKNSIKYAVIENGSSNIYSYLSSVNIKNCFIKYGDIGIESLGSKLEINNNNISSNKNYGIRSGASFIFERLQIINNLIKNNKIGIYSSSFFSTTIIKQNTIIDNYEYGVANNDASFILEGNKIAGNKKSGIICSGSIYAYPGIIKKNQIHNNIENGVLVTTPHLNLDLCNNIISQNQANGILIEMEIADGWSWDTEFNLYNNTIYKNEESGIKINATKESYSTAVNPGTNTIMNNIIALNKNYGVYIQKQSKTNHILYNNFFNNGTNILNEAADTLCTQKLVNANGDSCDLGYNIFLDPIFINPDLLDFNLQSNSPCINAGNPSAFYNDFDGSTNDIGAYGGTMLFLFPNPHLLNFGHLFVGHEKKLQFTIKNDRDIDFLIKKINLTDSINFNLDTDSSIILIPYQEPNSNYRKIISVFFKPEMESAFNEIINIISDDFYGTNIGQVCLHGSSTEGTQVSGQVSGIWKKQNNPYIITAKCTVPQADSLLIQAGVEIIFGNISYIEIQGTLKALGDKQDYILFRPAESNISKFGIVLFKNTNGKNKLRFCKFENLTEGGVGGIIVGGNSSLEIFDCNILNCRGGIYLEDCSFSINNSVIKNNPEIGIDLENSHGIINNCQLDSIDHNHIFIRGSSVEISKTNFRKSTTGNGIVCFDSDLIISNCNFSKIRGHDGGAIFSLRSNAIIENTIFDNCIALNGGGVIYSNNGKFQLLNCTAFNCVYHSYIYDSRYVIELYKFSSGKIINSIVNWTDDKNGYLIRPAASDSLFVIYSDIKGGYKGEGNIDADPLFIDSENSNFHLQPNSPCVDGGSDFIHYNDPEDPFNPGYAVYPAMGTIRNDMGAYGGPGAASFSVNRAPTAFNLLSPNDQDTIFTIHPLLNWQPAIDPNPGDVVSYTLYYDADNSFTNAAMVSGITTNSFQLHHLKDHQSYFWKVKAEDNQGASTFSNQVFQFNTFAAPLPFKLLSPASDDTVSTDTLSFSWQSAFDSNPADTIRYTFLCDSSRSFSKPITVTGISDTSFAFTDSLNNYTRYFWTVMAVDKDSFTTVSSDTFSFLVRYRPSGVAGSEGPELPTEFALSQNYPNPFNPTTFIKYQLPKDSHVTLKIFNLLGQNVATLVDKNQPAGYYSVSWEAGKMASGIYFYYLRAEEIAPDKSGSGFSKVSKMILLQ